MRSRKLKDLILGLTCLCWVATGCSHEGEPPPARTPPPDVQSRQAVPGQRIQLAEPARAAGGSGGAVMVPATPATPLSGRPLSSGAETTAPVISTLQPGAVAPDFVSRTLAGDEVRLSDWRGRVVVLDFWATWCGPCLASLPNTQDVAKRYKDRGVVVLATCTGDTRERFEQFVKANQGKYPDLVFTCDPNERGSATFDERASRKLYGVRGIPAQFVIGRDGKIAAFLKGFKEDDRRLQEALSKLGLEVDPRA